MFFNLTHVYMFNFADRDQEILLIMLPIMVVLTLRD